MIKMIQKLKNKKGFTLVELIVVIAIIAILTAVIVPLIARYSAQAQYTTLQDAAQTISNSANNALSDGNQISAVNVTQITGFKASGSLTITVGSGSGAKSQNGSTIVDSASTDDANTRVAKRLHASLLSALPDNCAFVIAVKQSAVEGVVYTSSATSLTANGTIKPVDGFDNAYEIANVSAIGVSGKWIPADSTGKTFDIGVGGSTPTT